MTYLKVKNSSTLTIVFLALIISLGLSGSQTHENKISRYPIVYNGDPAFYLAGTKDDATRARAKQASEKLKNAIEAPYESHEQLVQTKRTGEYLDLQVGEFLIMRFSQQDASLLGFKNINELAPYIEQNMNDFVRNQISSLRIKNLILGIAISILLIITTIFLLYKLGAVFRKLENKFSDKKYGFKPIVWFGLPIVSAETRCGLITLALSLGRVFINLVLLFCLAVLVAHQFDCTKNIGVDMIVQGKESIDYSFNWLISSLPRIISAFLIFSAIFALNRLIKIQLDGIKKKKFIYKTISSNKVPILRIVLPSLVFLAGAPFAFAALLGRYNSSLELIIAIIFAGIVLALIPVIGVWCIGAVIVWREDLKCGDWIQIGKFSGEICAINMQHIHLVPENGGTILIPSYYSLLNPIYRLCDLPKTSVGVKIKRTKSLDQILADLSLAVKKVHSDAEISCQDIGKHMVSLTISTPWVHKNIRHDLLMALAQAEEDRLLEFQSP